MKLLTLILILISSNVYAEKTVKLTGVIREVTCNNPSGLGYIILEQMRGGTLYSQAIKVNSLELCGSEPAHFSRLGSIGFDAVFSNQTSLFEVELTSGFITRVTVLRSVDYTRYTMKMTAMKREGEEAALDWFMNGPCAIQHHQENIPELVNLYTNGINSK